MKWEGRRKKDDESKMRRRRREKKIGKLLNVKNNVDQRLEISWWASFWIYSRNIQQEESRKHVKYLLEVFFSNIKYSEQSENAERNILRS